MKDMTEGSPVRLILTFALPLLLGNLLQQTYNIVDAAIVGQFLGSDALAGVGASSSIQFLVLGFCIGTTVGFCIPVAQKFGARDYSVMRKYIFNGIFLTAVIGAVLTVLTAVLCGWIVSLLRTPQEIFDGAYAYLFVIFLGIPCTLLYNLCAGILRAIGDSRTPFYFLALSTVLNIFLDLFCILTLHWGVAGAAIATVVSQGISGVLCAAVIIRKFTFLKFEEHDRRIETRIIRRLILMGVPMGLQFSITAIGSMVMQAANNGLGTVYVSGFTAGMKIKQFAMCPFDALATGVSTFCAQNLGAGRNDRIRTGVRKGVLIGILYGAGIGLVLIFFGRQMSLLFLKPDQTEILTASAQYLACMGYFYWALGILNVTRMVTQAIGYAGRAMVSGVIEMIARSAVATIFVPMFGFQAICWTDQAAWLTATLYIAPICYFSLRQAEKKRRI